MAELPTGTVTLLFTDIEGSTRLLEDLGRERYAEALARHRDILRHAFAERGGYEVDYEGDAFFVSFPSATAAVGAAVAAQRALASEDWPDGGAPVQLSAKEYELLIALAEDPERVFKKEELLRNVWGFRSLGRTHRNHPI
jgi:class 3 adenylate cyclase